MTCIHLLLLNAARTEFFILEKRIVEGLGHLVVGLDPDQVHQFKRPHAKARAFHQPINDSVVSDPFFEHFQALHVKVACHPIHDKVEDYTWQFEYFDDINFATSSVINIK